MAVGNAPYLGPVGVGTFILRAPELAVIALTLHFGRVANNDNVRYEAE